MPPASYPTENAVDSKTISQTSHIWNATPHKNYLFMSAQSHVLLVSLVHRHQNHAMAVSQRHGVGWHWYVWDWTDTHGATLSPHAVHSRNNKNDQSHVNRAILASVQCWCTSDWNSQSTFGPPVWHLKSEPPAARGESWTQFTRGLIKKKTWWFNLLVTHYLET